MKKNVSSILVVIIVLVFMVTFSACEKFKPSNLRANYQLKKANGHYAEEKYKKAIDAYLEALKENPELKVVYLYLGTSYSSVYRPLKEDERNKMFGNEGIKYLKLAQEFDPENEQVVLALGDLYDKMGNIEEAEKCYLGIMEKKKDDPKSYYTLANFYAKNGKTDAADDMYKKRIELNPEDPEGYHYYVGYLQDQRSWPSAIEAHENRLYAILDSSIILTKREIFKLMLDEEEITKVNKFIDQVKKNKRVDKDEKQRLIDEANQRLEGKLPIEETKKKIEELKTQMAEKVTAAEATIEGLDEETKKKVTEAYYSIGNVCWNWSYQTNIDFMAAQEREPILTKGLTSLENAIKISPDYANPYSYMGLLYREMIKVNPLKRDEYVKKNEEFNKKFINIYKRAQRSDAYRKELEDIGKDK
jgi:pentatricopeptide repeat protein